eukprot:16618-Heterococcus_DN1.PRE.1
MEFGGPVPTFDDLSIDDNMSQLDRVVKYSTSTIALQRLVHVKMLGETAASLGYDETDVLMQFCIVTTPIVSSLIHITVRCIVPLFEALSLDEEYVVRQHLGEQMEPIARTCYNTTAATSSGSSTSSTATATQQHAQGGGYRLIIETILPILSRLLGDSKAEVRATAGQALKGVASLMKPSDLGQYVLTIVLQLAHDDANEELPLSLTSMMHIKVELSVVASDNSAALVYTGLCQSVVLLGDAVKLSKRCNCSGIVSFMRMTAAAVLNDLAQVLGPDLCQQFVTPDMVSLSEDPVFRVRKATALNLHHICRVAGEQDSRDRLLPAYIRLTKDDMYRVRKACTESLVEVSKAVGPKLSHEVLTEVFMRLAGDSQKVVRNGALQHLGPFISTLPGDKISQELVAYFTSTACAGVVTTVSTTTTSANANTSATSTTNGAAAANNSSSNMASSSSSNGGTAVTSGTVTAAAASNSGIAANSSSSGIVMPSTLTIGGGDPQSDDELRLYCAFSFPAVVLTLGPSRWPELRNAYHILTKDQ